jgi:hypothetical protein
MDEDVGVGAGPAERAPHAGGGGPAPTPRRLMSAGRKREAVLRLLRGEDLELVSRELRVTAAELSGWRDAFLAAGEASYAPPPRLAHRLHQKRARAGSRRSGARRGSAGTCSWRSTGRARRRAGRRLTAPRLAGPRSRRGGPSWRRRTGRERGGSWISAVADTHRRSLVRTGHSAHGRRVRGDTRLIRAAVADG